MFFDNLFSDFDPFSTYTYRQPQRRTPMSYYDDNKTIILRKLINDDYNYICFDCHKQLNNLNYFDIKNGIFLCYNCAQKHVHLPKEISLVMTGNIKSLEENYLMILYYGGNKNLLEFIKRNYPLLENYNIKEKYSSKAMDYYRKLLRSKAFDEEEPEMPEKKQGYNSIFYNKISPSKENNRNHRRNIKNKENEENNEDNNEDNEDNNDIFSSTFFGDDLFGRHRRNQNQRKRSQNKNDNKKENNENNYMKTEPADINAKNVQENKINNAKKVNSNSNKKENKVNKQVKEEKKEKIVNTTITINQIGELSRYPDAMEIDGMECE